MTLKDDAPAMLGTSGSVAESQPLSKRPSVPEDNTADDLSPQKSADNVSLNICTRLSLPTRA